MTFSNKCSGCLNFASKRSITCLMTIDYKYTKYCPCINCIVKMICDENCYKFEEFLKKVKNGFFSR